MATRAREAAPLDLSTIAGTGAPGDWSPRGLRARCAGLRLQLTTRDVDETILAAWWPGGAENPGKDRPRPTEKDRGPWTLCFATYHRLVHDQAHARSAATAGQSEALNRAIADAAADRPETLVLSDGAMWQVYPKSEYALQELRYLGDAIDRLTRLDVASVERGVPVPPDTTALRSLAVRVWCWIITHPGPGLPYPEDARDPEPPAALGLLAPQDHYALVAANHRVNGAREAIMARAFPRRSADFASRLDFVGFLTAYADAKHLDPFDVLRRWSRGRVVAAAVSAAITADEAQQRAERERAAKGGTSDLPHRGG